MLQSPSHPEDKITLIRGSAKATVVLADNYLKKQQKKSPSQIKESERLAHKEFRLAAGNKGGIDEIFVLMDCALILLKMSLNPTVTRIQQSLLKYHVYVRYKKKEFNICVKTRRISTAEIILRYKQSYISY